MIIFPKLLASGGKDEKAQKSPSSHTLRIPPSGLKPTGNLAPRVLQLLAEELAAYHAKYADFFGRPEQGQRAVFYLRGMLSEIEPKTVEPMLLSLKGSDPATIRALQQFLGEGAWDDLALLERRERLVADDIGEADGVIIVDGSGFPKKGDYSVGVSRQYCGALGKIANSQQGVFAAYGSSLGYSFIDRRLYMPKEWFSQEYGDKRQRCGVPDEVGFKTEPQLGLEMVEEIARRGVLRFEWVAVDEDYGMSPDFLDAVTAFGKW